MVNRLKNLSTRLQAWKSKGHIQIFREQEIHCLHLVNSNTKSAEGPTHFLVFLHGYPNSSFDWHKTIELFEQESANSETNNYSILAFDFLGFGFSSKPPNHDYTLLWQADLAEELVERFNKRNLPVFVIAHDMGTTVGCELFARDLESKLNFNLVGSLLFNGNMDMARSSLILGQKLLRNQTLGGLFSRLSNSWIFKWQLGSVFGPKYPMTSEEGKDQWDLLTWNDGNKINHKLIAYTFERVRLADRFLGAYSKWDKNLWLAWGLEDPVATTWQFEGLKERRPNVPNIELNGIGHFPQIESPKSFYASLTSILDELKLKSK